MRVYIGVFCGVVWVVGWVVGGREVAKVYLVININTYARRGERKGLQVRWLVGGLAPNVRFPVSNTCCTAVFVAFRFLRCSVGLLKEEGKRKGKDKA